jgi:hypothetical protein
MGKAAQEHRRPYMSAILMIIVFIAVMGLLNRVEFGRFD